METIVNDAIIDELDAEMNVGREPLDELPVNVTRTKTSDIPAITVSKRWNKEWSVVC